MGADEVICTETEDVAARVKDITSGKGAWGAVDAVAGTLTQHISAAVRDGGSVIVYGGMGGLQFTGSVMDVLFRGCIVKGFFLNAYLAKLSAEHKAAVFAEVIGLLADGSLVPHSGQRFPLSDVVAALEASQATARDGKVLLM